MGNKIIKQSNALITASYKLTTIEKKLICLGVANSNGNEDALRSCEIHASQYAEQFNVSLKAAYKALHDAAIQLFDRKWSYKEKGQKGSITKLRRWVQGVDYGQGDGVIKLIFSDDVLPVLIDLKKTFTYYDLKAIANLSSIYAIRLYELVIQWQSIGKTPIFELGKFRNQLGVDSNEYLRMTDFKRRVLDFAVDQINEHTDITVSYEQHKRGRSISGFSFTFKQKNTAQKLTTIKPEKRKNITKAEAQAMAKIGESWHDLYTRLSSKYNISNV